MSRINIGKVAPIPKGDWVQSQPYEKLNMVSKSGVLYIAKQDVPANTAITNTDYWMPANGQLSIGTVETVSASTGASATITDGSNGPELNLSIPRGVTGNESIDDTKGKGDTDYVWSADKNYEEINKLYNNKLDASKTNELTGSIVTFEAENDHAIKDLTIEINPAQDLHGYDNPWPAGGGKNLFNPAEAVDGEYVANENGTFYTATGSARTGYIEIKPDTRYVFSPSKSAGNWGAWYDENKTFISGFSGTAPNASPSNAKYVIFTINRSNNTPNYLDVTQIEQGNTATSYTPYSNICPITGWDEVNITRTGKNLCDQSAVTLGMLTESNGIYSASDADTRSTLYFKLNQYNGNTYIPNSAVVSSAITSIGKISLTTTILSGCTKLHFRNAGTACEFYFSMPMTPLMWGKQVTFSAYILDKTIGAVKFTEPQLELGQTASDYIPYQPIQTVTIDLDDTRYGGVVDVLAGKMTVDRAIVDLGTLTWNKQTFENQKINFRCTVNGQKLVPDSAVANIICDSLQTVTALKMMNDLSYEYGISARGSTVSGLRVCYSSYNTLTASEFTTAMSGIQATYELATPFTIQLTPEQLSSVIGTNYLWADTGDSTVTLRLPPGDLAYQDTVDYETQITNKPNFGSMLSESENSLTATKNYNKDTLISIGDNLYKTLVNISSGSALVIGSNIATTTIETELALKANSSNVYTKAEIEDYIESEITTYHDDTKATAITEFASGNIVNFTDGANSTVEGLKINIEPIQDLHGYDAPWPANGGKNILPIRSDYNANGITMTWNTDGSLTFSGTATDICNATIPISLPSGTTVTFSANNNAPIGAGVRFRLVAENGSEKQVYLSGSNTTATWTLDYDIIQARFTVGNGYDASGTIYPQLELGSSKTSFAPYSNICPISGWTSAVVTRTGKNLWSNDYFATQTNPMTLITDPTDPDYGYYNGKMASWDDNYNFYVFPEKEGYLGKLPLGVVTTSFMAKVKDNDAGTNITFRVYYKYSDGTASYNGNINEISKTPARYYRTSDPTKTCIGVCISSTAGANTANQCIKDVQIELGNMMTDYEEPTRQQVTIDLDGTRYGGTLDILMGEMTVTHGIVTLNQNNGWGLPGSHANGYSCYRLAEGSAGFPTNVKLYSSVVCDKFESNIGASYAYSKSMLTVYKSTNTSSQWIFSVPNSIADAQNQTSKTAWETWLASNPITVAYELATPIIVQLSPSQIQTLLGQNNIFANTGDIEVTYRADTKLYIEKLTQPTEDDMIANNNIEANKFFMLGNSLYYSTAAIAVGTSIIPGDNCTKLSLADALNNLNS